MTCRKEGWAERDGWDPYLSVLGGGGRGREQARILRQGLWAQGPWPGTHSWAFCELPKLSTLLSLVSINANTASIF